jgi:hypothetical protein
MEQAIDMFAPSWFTSSHASSVSSSTSSCSSGASSEGSGLGLCVYSPIPKGMLFAPIVPGTATAASGTGATATAAKGDQALDQDVYRKTQNCDPSKVSVTSLGYTSGAAPTAAPGSNLIRNAGAVGQTAVTPLKNTDFVDTLAKGPKTCTAKMSTASGSNALVDAANTPCGRPYQKVGDKTVPNLNAWIDYDPAENCKTRARAGQLFETWRSMFGLSCQECGYEGKAKENNFIAPEGTRNGMWIPLTTTNLDKDTKSKKIRGIDANNDKKTYSVLKCGTQFCDGRAQKAYGLPAIYGSSGGTKESVGAIGTKLGTQTYPIVTFSSGTTQAATNTIFANEGAWMVRCCN